LPKGDVPKKSSIKLLHKALGISLLVHLAIIVALTVFPLLSAREHYTPLYQVSMVTLPEPKPKKTTVPVRKKKPPAKKPTSREKKAAPRQKKQKKKEVRKKGTTDAQSLKRVQRSIHEIKERMVSRQNLQEEYLKTSKIIEAKRNAYFDAIAARIQANWSLLKNQMENVGALRTDIGLHIQRDGTVTQIVIEKPSGNALFDEFAVRAVKKSTPLPPFPKELRDDTLEVTIGLST